MRRKRRGGFTLLESLIAFAILAMVIGVAYAAISQSLGRQARLAQDLELSRFARAMLTEYVVTYPALPPQGAFDGRLAWQITEELKPFAPAERAALPGVAPVQITIDVRRLDDTGAPLRMATALLRRTTAP